MVTRDFFFNSPFRHPALPRTSPNAYKRNIRKPTEGRTGLLGGGGVLRGRTSENKSSRFAVVHASM